MALAVNNIIQISYRGECLSQRILFVHQYRVLTAPSGTNTVAQDLDAILVAISPNIPAGLGGLYTSTMPTNYTMRESRAQVLYPTRSAFRSNFTSFLGNNELPAATANLASSLTLRTALSGRSQRATKHVGPLTGDGFENGYLLASFKTPLLSLANKLTQDISFGTAGVLRSIVYHKNGDGPAAKYTDVEGYSVGETVRVMRRRTVGVGE